ncbi:zinc knuckle CX2CX4HX4C containing protein [Tanacetum coccineum]|uniref:Zinc knuckle CX2CX4HX4C containing protein n=1 Tax=Tanacetum coccineum TaxID=301880 RepID=A0ABQ5GP87_9ASTR
MDFPVVEYFAWNNWSETWAEKDYNEFQSFFFFKFDSHAGLEAVLEGGPWLIRKSPVILKKWSMDTRLLKEELTSILIWVKLHDTLIGNDSWGRSSFSRCLIEVNSEADLVDVVTIGILSLIGEWGCPATVTTSNVVTPTVEKTNDSFQTVGKKKKRKDKSSLLMVITSPRPILFFALNEEDEEENVENMYEESTNLFTKTKAGGSSSFTAVAG